MSELKKALAQAADTLAISLDEEQLNRFDLYYNLLVDWNSRMNLTAITAP